jgi:hypothetical protein
MDDYATQEAASGPEEAGDTTGPGLDLAKIQREWAAKLDEAEKDARNYRDEVKRSIKWLRLDKNGRKAKANGERLNIAFANYEILRSSTYSRPPKAVIVPRFGGGDQRAQLDALAQVMERAVESNNERTNVHDAFETARDELLKAGRGVIWMRYEPTFVDQDMPVLDGATGAPMLDQTGQPMMAPQKVKKDERVLAEPVGWNDYLEGKAQHWRQVPWVARRVPMDKTAFASRFGDEAATRCGIKFTEETGFDKKKNVEGPAVDVWEIWCRQSATVYCIVQGALEAVEATEPFLNFEGFFPCPEPAMSCFEDGSRTPIADLLMIEDQLVEIDALTKRIDALRSALKVRGFYPKGATATSAAGQIERAVQMTDDRQVLIPVEGWAANGQAKMDIVWLPIDTVVAVIQQCAAMRKEAIELVYQITGISDVMRGASEAQETLGAQQIKAQWGSVRVRNKQGEMARLCRDVCRMTAEIVCELFDAQTIAKAAVYGFDPAMLDFFRNEGLRSFLIDVETDSTIQADEEADKKSRIEFLTAMGGMIQQMMPVIQTAPELLPMAAAMLKFAAQGFRVGRELEKEIDGAVQAIQQRLAAPKPPPQPDPTEVAKTQATQVKAAAEVQKSNNDVAISNIDLQAKMHQHRANIAAAAAAPPPTMPPGGVA